MLACRRWLLSLPRLPTRLASASTSSMLPVRDRINSLQARTQLDEGGRGIGPLVEAGGEEALYKAATALAEAPLGKGSIVVLTGFPCCMDNPCPLETDGVPGAVALAHTLSALGHDVVLPIEEYAEAQVVSVLDACLRDRPALRSRVRVQPVSLGPDGAAQAEDLRASAVACVAVERAGASKDGTCCTMRALPMENGTLIQPALNTALMPAERTGDYFTVGIGDGGNEAGMGNVQELVEEHVRNGDRIASVTGCDHLIVSSVSNWGGYVLAVATRELARQRGSAAAEATDAVPTEAEVARAITACNDVGIVDGVCGRSDGFVDGMPLQTHTETYDEFLWLSRQEGGGVGPDVSSRR